MTGRKSFGTSFSKYVYGYVENNNAKQNGRSYILLHLQRYAFARSKATDSEMSEFTRINVASDKTADVIRFANSDKRMGCAEHRVIKIKEAVKRLLLAGETRFEHATNGFGDRCSTVEPLPYGLSIKPIQYIKQKTISQTNVCDLEIIMQNKFTLGLIGAGNMATAIVDGILKDSVISADKILISDTNDERLEYFSQKGVGVTTDNKTVASCCENLLFAVKPQHAEPIFEEIKEVISADTVISIMAGVTTARLRSCLGDRNYVRVMPNTPALIGEGMSAIAFSGGRNNEFALDIFRSLGKVIEVDESLFDAVTSVSGSGPAYVYMFIKAMIEGGIDGGLSPESAKMLTLQTVVGAAKMIEASDKQIDELIESVCSKGGTTIRAVDSFKNDGLDEIIRRGMKKCKQRSEELGK